MSEIKEQYYEIYIRGIQFDDSKYQLVEEVTFEDNATGSDLLHIALKDPDYRFIEDDLIVEESPVNFAGGWRGDTVSFEGFISVIDIDYPLHGVPTITLHCMDNSHIMNRKKKKRTWKNVKMSTVAESIFKEHGFIPIVDDTDKIEETISQSNTTDISFLISKAKDQSSEFICYVEGNKGYFVKRKILDNPQDTLEYFSGNGKLLSFRPRINKESKQESVDRSNIDTQSGTIVKDTTTNKDDRELQGTPTDTSEKRKYVGNNTWVSMSKISRNLPE